MSDNNKSTGRKDSFAVPGDESIVSGGKSFFLSFGKQKKGPANPLLESERQKAAAEKSKSSDGGNGNNSNNNNNNGNNNGKGGRNDHRDRKNKKFDRQSEAKNGAQPEKTQAERPTPERNSSEDNGQGKRQKFGKGRDRDRNGAVKGEQPNERRDRPETAKKADAPQSEGKRADVVENGSGGNNNNNNNGKGGRYDRRDKRNRKPDGKSQDAKQFDVRMPDGKAQDRQADKAGERHAEKHGGAQQSGKGSAGVNGNASGKNDRSDIGKGDNNHRRGDRRDGKGKGREDVAPEAARQTDRGGARPKHKKEKFVPSAPGQPLTDESLLQPIVNRTGIISGGTSGAFSSGTRSKFGIGAFTGETDDDVIYIDKTRPLAEQIAERSKPQTFARSAKSDTADESTQETVEVIGVRFREAGKVYYFAPANYSVAAGEAVIVETARGIEYGFCAIGNRRVSATEIVAPLKPILRKATDEDTETYVANKALEASAAQIFREKVALLKLDMSLVYVEYTFDKGKLLFYFTADGRVDFRELIKELAAAFRTRIELRQIGVRDEAKIVGGLGICGRPVCCKSFLGEFSQVSIKMAKDQNLFLNSSKISGTCGRFMCCIRYEDEVYQKEYEKTPKVDAIVETELGRGTVIESNALKGTVKVLLDNEPDSVPKPFNSSEVKVVGYIKRDNEDEIPDGVDEDALND